jgi:hypothetical protein
MCCARVIITAKAKIDGHKIIFDKVVVSKKSWRRNYTPRREFPYINAECLIVNLPAITTYVVASVFFFGVITFVTVCTEVDATQERSHAGNHIVVVVMVVQVDLLIVTAKAKIDRDEQWNSIQRGRRIQEELA